MSSRLFPKVKAKTICVKISFHYATNIRLNLLKFKFGPNYIEILGDTILYT